MYIYICRERERQGQRQGQRQRQRQRDRDRERERQRERERFRGRFRTEHCRRRYSHEQVVRCERWSCSHNTGTTWAHIRECAHMHTLKHSSLAAHIEITGQSASYKTKNTKTPNPKPFIKSIGKTTGKNLNPKCPARKPKENPHGPHRPACTQAVRSRNPVAASGFRV